VEKYLKATLLFNGRSARYISSGGKKKREFGHDLDALLSEVGSISIFHFEIEPEDEKFLSYLSSQGGANRYLSTSAYNLPDALLRLDRLVWHVRRYCQYIPNRGAGSGGVVPGLQEAVVRTITDPAKKMYPHSLRFPVASWSGDQERSGGSSSKSTSMGKPMVRKEKAAVGHLHKLQLIGDTPERA